jgi:SAM-dependent methyltransferase
MATATKDIPTATGQGFEAASPEEKLWAALDAEGYDSAVYGSELLRSMYEGELAIAQRMMLAHDVLVEVGVGTGKFAGLLSGNGYPVIGVDISPTLLEVAKRRYPELLLIEGDGRRLGELLDPLPAANGRRLVACVLNSIGVVDAVIREALVREMIRSSAGGSFLLAVFSAEHFHRGIAEFYGRSPQLCGPVREGDADYIRHELRTTSSYFSHWFTVAEIDDLLRAAGVRSYSVERCGVGLFFSGPIPKGA